MVLEFSKRDEAIKKTAVWFEKQIIVELYWKGKPYLLPRAEYYEEAILSHKDLKYELAQHSFMKVGKDVLTELYEPIKQFIYSWPEDVEDYINKLIGEINEEHPNEVTPNDAIKHIFNVKQVLSSFLNTVKEYLKKYEEIHEVVTNSKPLEVTVTKLYLNLSMPQIAALFSALREMKIITETGNTELARQIAAAFTTKGTDDINVKKLAEQISNPDTKALDFWLDNIKELRIKLTNLKHPNI